MIVHATRIVAIDADDTGADYFGTNTAPPDDGRLEVTRWRSIVVTAYCTKASGVIVPAGPTFVVPIKLIRVWNVLPKSTAPTQAYHPITALNVADIELRDRIDNIISEPDPPALGWVFPQILAAATNPPVGATKLCIRLAYEKDL